MSKNQKRIVGAIHKVPLGDGTHIYAQVLPEADFVFYDTRTSDEKSPDQILDSPILFRVAVHKSAWSTGRWGKIYKATVHDSLMVPVPTFIQDTIDPNKFQIYIGGEIRKATKEECMGLECCAVWDPEHVEERIRDHYAGRPNVWFESMKIKDSQNKSLN